MLVGVLQQDIPRALTQGSEPDGDRPVHIAPGRVGADPVGAGQGLEHVGSVGAGRLLFDRTPGFFEPVDGIAEVARLAGQVIAGEQAEAEPVEQPWPFAEHQSGHRARVGQQRDGLVHRLAVTVGHALQHEAGSSLSRQHREVGMVTAEALDGVQNSLGRLPLRVAQLWLRVIRGQGLFHHPDGFHVSGDPGAKRMIGWYQIRGLPQVAEGLAGIGALRRVHQAKHLRHAAQVEQQRPSWLEFRGRGRRLEQGNPLVQIAAALLHQAQFAGHGGLIEEGTSHAHVRERAERMAGRGTVSDPDEGLDRLLGQFRPVFSYSAGEDDRPDHRLADHSERVVRRQFRHRLLQPGTQPGHGHGTAPGERQLQDIDGHHRQSPRVFRVAGRHLLQRIHELLRFGGGVVGRAGRASLAAESSP